MGAVAGCREDVVYIVVVVETELKDIVSRLLNWEIFCGLVDYIGKQI